jgi:hypothetical protein
MGCMHLVTCRARAQKSGYTSYNSVYVPTLCSQQVVRTSLITLISSARNKLGFLGHPVQYSILWTKMSMLGRGGAPCNGLYVQFVPCPFEYSSLFVCLMNICWINFVLNKV